MGIDMTCPTCGHYDQVQRVPAIRATGTTTVYGQDYHSGIAVSSGGPIPVIGSTAVERTHSTRLAQSLALAPARTRSGKLVVLGLIFAIPAMLFVLIAIVASGEPEARANMPMFIAAITLYILALATPSLILFMIATNRTRRNNKISRGLPAANQLWNLGLYCHRCGYCFWPYPAAPGIPARQPISPDNYRHIVWSAGGYANL